MLTLRRKSAQGLHAVALLASLCFACGKEDDADGRAAAEDFARTLQNEVANTVEVPERVERNVNAGDESWESTFRETTATSRNGFTTRGFEIIIRNQASSPQKFRATVRFLDRDRMELRSRTTREVVVAPYAESTIADSVTMPDRLSARVVDAQAEVEVVPWDEENKGDG